MTRLYISGPVTGKPDDNREAFDNAADALNDNGYYVIIPHWFVDADVSHEGAMLFCINELTVYDWSDVPLPRYDGVALLPGWEQSGGARLERTVAEACGIPCKTVDEWLEEAR